VAVNRNSANGKKPLTATLIAEVPVVVVDVSRAGCLIESTRPLEPGVVGTLRLSVDGRDYVEDFRVARCTALSGRGSTFRIGLEFLRTRRVADISLRHAVTHLTGPGPSGESAALLRSPGGSVSRDAIPATARDQ
jgi:hypothetical protein